MERPGGVRLRSVEACDAEWLAALVRRSGAADWSPAQLRSARLDPAARTRLVTTPAEGGRETPIAFVLARRVADLLEIDLVGVDPAHRRRGHARTALAALLAEQSEAGVREARLELSEHNAAARALYAGLGFVVVGRRARYYPSGEDALLLSRGL